MAIAALSRAPAPAIVSLAVAGQMLAKFLLYQAGKGVLRLKFIRWERRDAALATFEKYRHHSLALVGFSALTGFPPFYGISLLSGAVRLPLASFLTVGTIGRVCPIHDRVPGARMAPHRQVKEGAVTTWIRRRLAAAARRKGEVRLFASAMASQSHPVMALVVTDRRCNLECAYCNEFDKVSRPVPLDQMLARIDRLGQLRTSLIMLTGGEPLLHPDIETIVARVRRTGALCALLSNGYLLTPSKIEALNRAGLNYLQMSIDNVLPDDMSRKSLTLLEKRLKWLADRATFAVTINSVLAPGMREPKDALTVARRARELGFNSTIAIVHDGSGYAKPLPPEQLEVYEEVRRLENTVFSFSHLDRFQRNLARGIANDWHCGAGSRFLYICENGLVHYCSQQRGQPAIPLAEYTQADLEREWNTKKPCTAHCSLSCVHQVAFLDEIRDKPREMLKELVENRRASDPGFNPPWVLRAAAWTFLENDRAAALGQAAARIFRLTPTATTPRGSGAARARSRRRCWSPSCSGRPTSASCPGSAAPRCRAARSR